MNDKEFSELHLRVTIVPQQVRWPAPKHLHWQKLHDAANEARSRVSRFYHLADEIDRNMSLSSDAKYRRRSEAAAQAIAGFDSSKTLVLAIEAVERLATQRNYAQNLSPEMAEDTDAVLRAITETEKGWQRAIDKIAQRSSQTRGPTSTYGSKLPPRLEVRS